MLHRWVAVFLAFVLLWSGLGTTEPVGTAVAPAPAPVQLHALAVGAEPAEPGHGLVHDQPVDGVPSQPQADSTSETPGLLPAPLTPGASSLAMVRTLAFRLDAWCTPVLAGPLRPPCRAGAAA